MKAKNSAKSAKASVAASTQKTKGADKAVTDKKVKAPVEKATKVKAASTATHTAAPGASEPSQKNFMLLTTGFRARAINDKECVKLPKTLPKKQSDLEAYWSKQLDQSEFVVGGASTADAEGIFSKAFVDQVAQILPLDSIWCFSNGLGTVSLSNEIDYPQYDLGEYESSLRGITEDFSDRLWWNFVSSGENSICALLQRAISEKAKLIVCLQQSITHVVRDDLKKIVSTYKDDPNAYLHHLRIIGSDIAGVIDPVLLPCLMPADRAALDVVVPGKRIHGLRRYAKLITHVCSDKPGPATEDRLALLQAFKSKTALCTYATKFETAKAYKKLSSAEIRSMITKKRDEGYEDYRVISRLLRTEGVLVTIPEIKKAIGKSAD